MGSEVEGLIAGEMVPRTIVTPRDDIVPLLFEPALSWCTEYRRAVGYFSSAWIARNAVGLARLASRGGVAKWVTSPHLSEDDWLALTRHTADAGSLLERAVLNDVEKLAQVLEEDTRNTIGWMVYDGLLQFKIAVPAAGNRHTDFHSKFGIFLLEGSPVVAFIGSLNESERAFENHEVVSVFHRQRLGELERVQELNGLFDELWAGQNAGYTVYSLPEAARRRLVELRTYERPYENSGTSPYRRKLRKYQDEAMSAWIRNGHRGLLEMATGTGKTLTALAGVEYALSLPDPPKVVLIACPFQHLVDQWVDQLYPFQLPIVAAYGSTAEWVRDLSDAVLSLEVGTKQAIFVVTTYATLTSDALARGLASLATQTFFVADECHYLGGQKTRRAMREEYELRLGLSATPSRHYDFGGTEAILSYFGGVVYEFGLERAIADGFLVPYYYYPEIVELTSEETEEYIVLSAQLGRLMAGKPEPTEAALRVAIRRSRLLNNATNKIEWLREKLSERPSSSWEYTLVYAGDKIFQGVTKLVGLELGIRTHEFTSRQSRRQRSTLLERFEQRDLQVLVAMRCLDEGVDVPPTRQAFFLASSGNPREFVQRRGRILRRAEGKESAVVVDAIALPSPTFLSTIRGTAEWRAARAALRSQLARITEFSKLALNSAKADEVTFALRLEYDLPQYEPESGGLE